MIEQYRAHEIRAADSTNRHIQLLRTRPGKRNRVLDVFHRQRRMHHQHHGCAVNQRDRGKVAHRIVIHFFDQRPYPVRAAGKQQRVTVRWRFGHDIRNQHRGPVVHHDLLAQRPCQRQRDQARGKIVAAADGRGNDAQRFHGKFLAIPVRRCTSQYQRSQTPRERLFHGCSSV